MVLKELIKNPYSKYPETDGILAPSNIFNKKPASFFARLDFHFQCLGTLSNHDTPSVDDASLKKFGL